MLRLRIPHVSWLAVILVSVCAQGRTAVAQTVAEPALKAAFLYNFAKFTEWPSSAAPTGSPLRLCIADSAVADALEPSVAGRSIGGHPLTLARVAPPPSAADDSLRTCALLYVPGLDAKRTADLVLALQGAPVFSVSDSNEFATLGGTAYFFVEADRMRFGINAGAAERAHLRLSAQLLSLARLVRNRSK